MPRRTYSEEKKAAVLAALLTGQAVSKVAGDFGIPIGTVKGWKSKEIAGTEANPVITQKKAALGDMILGLLEQELITLQAIARHAQSKEWFDEQDAADMAVFYGVMHDKAGRKIDALTRNAEFTDA